MFVVAAECVNKHTSNACNSRLYHLHLPPPPSFLPVPLPSFFSPPPLSSLRLLSSFFLRYKPHEMELESKLKCFIPEYIATVGELDAFIKVPRPDGEDDRVGAY